MVVLLLALGLRLAHVAELRADVLFEHPPLDEDRYVEEARRLAAGRPWEPRPFWQPPGILFALGAVFSAFGDKSLLSAHVVQALVSTLACGLVFLVARRLFDVRVGLVSAAIVALHGGLVFTAGELLPATWAGVFDLVALLLLLDAKESRKHAVGAGLALGISAVFTPVILPFAVLAGMWLAREKSPHAGAFALAVALPILPITWRNYQYSGDLVLVSTNGGLNFFIGNNARYFETWNVRPGIHWSELADAPRAFGITKPVESSAWFTGQALAFVRAHPLDALALYLRKLLLFFHAAEIPRDSDVYLARKGVLRVLLAPRPLWLPGSALMAFAAVGLVSTARDAKTSRLPMAFLFTLAASVALFFVSGRYRVPVVPVLALYAAVGVFAVMKAQGRARLLLIGVAVGAGLLSIVPAREATTKCAAEPELFRGLALRKMGDAAGARAAFERGTTADPNDARPFFELGVQHDLAKNHAEAARAWERAGACDPTDLRARRMAATAWVRAGDRGAAIAAYRANIASQPLKTVFDRMQIAALHAEAGAGEEMLAEVRGAIEVDARFVKTTAHAFADSYRSKLDPAIWTRFDQLTR